MRRGVFDVLRRGLDNTIANWPLVALRLGEAVVIMLIAIGGAVAIVAPILVSIGINIANLSSPEGLENAAMALMNRWVLLLWVFLAVSVLVLVFVAVHSFVEAGSARVYVDAERAAGPVQDAPRARFAVFSMERWLAGGVDGWWTVFWIYNLAWALASTILLIPLLPTAALLLAMRDRAEPGASIAVGCLGLMATFFLLIVLGVATTIWVNRAIAEWAARRSGARAALAASWRAIRADFGRHVLGALVLFAVLIGGSSFFSSFSMFAGLQGGETAFALMTLPIQLVASLCSSAFSSAATAWFLASYASMAAE